MKFRKGIHLSEERKFILTITTYLPNPDFFLEREVLFYEREYHIEITLREFGKDINLLL